MRGGHNIKSTAEKKAQGTSRKYRDANRLENKVEYITTFRASPFSDQRHSEKWDETCRAMVLMGVLTENDYDAIESYVRAWFVSFDAWADVEKNGSVLWIETAVGKKPMQNPSFRIYIDSQKIVKSFAEQFGFTPRSRQSINLKPQETEADPLAAFFSSN